MSYASPLLQNVLISQTNNADLDITDYVQELDEKSKTFTAEEGRDTTTLQRIETLNDSIISSVVVTIAFLPIFNFNLDVDLGTFVVITAGIYMILNCITIYILMHQKRLNNRFGVAFTNTFTKGFFWTSQGLFFYALNVLKPRLIGLDLNPIYILFFLWLYIGFWEHIKLILSNNNNSSKTKTK